MRYEDTGTVTLRRATQYEKLLKKRKIHSAKLRTTPTFISPADLDFSIVTETEEIWGPNSKLWKLAAEHYGDGSLYWVIGLYNMRPTDAHWELGDLIYIPHPHQYVADQLRGT